MEIEDIKLNLIDAGLTEQEKADFMCSNSKTEQMRVLSICRKRLVEVYHRDGKCLDCLDYLIRELNKDNF